MEVNAEMKYRDKHVIETVIALYLLMENSNTIPIITLYKMTEVVAMFLFFISEHYTTLYE